MEQPNRALPSRKVEQPPDALTAERALTIRRAILTGDGPCTPEEVRALVDGRWLGLRRPAAAAFKLLACHVLDAAGGDRDEALAFLWHETGVRTHDALRHVSEAYHDPAWLRRELWALVDAVEDEQGAGVGPAAVVAGWATRGALVHEPTGIGALDEMTGGGLPYGTRAYLVGAPDAGKTLLLAQLGHVLAERGVTVGFLSVDEEPADVVTRLAQRLGHSREDCERRDAGDLGRIRRALGRLPLRFYTTETIEKAAADLAARAKRRGSTAALLVDSLQTCRCRAETKSKGLGLREVVSARVAAVRAVAEEHGLIAVVTSEMGRSYYRNREAAAELDDMAAGKESGAIEYSARILLSLRSVPGRSDLVELRLAKNKHGPRHRPDEDGIFLRVDRARQRLDTVEDFVPTSREARAGNRANLEAAGHVAVILARHPGVTKRELCTKARAAAGGLSRERLDVALLILEDAVSTRTGKQRAEHHFLDGSKVPEEVLEQVPEEDREAVRSARGGK